MKVIVTCGPAFEPIDEVRRITNFSTGELGVILANRLSRDGHKVFCLKGIAATHLGKVTKAKVIPFGTNEDLLEALRMIAESEKIDAVFHAAALCDFKVKRVEDKDGKLVKSAKIRSNSSALTIQLKPAPKVISQLRTIFPKSHLIGWKYELEGNRNDALKKGWQQIAENETDGCVVNGRAFGPGFACCFRANSLHECKDKIELSRFFSKWLREN